MPIVDDYSLVEAIINLSALAYNARTVRELAPRSALMAVIKANAYGHGMLPVARALQPRVDGFAVARFEEAMTLRQQGIDKPVLMLSGRPDHEQLQQCARHSIDIVVHDAATARLIAQSAVTPALGIWLKIDTGMHRLGVAPAQASPIYRLLSASPAVNEIVLMSHFASAEQPHNAATQRQLHCFDATIAGLEGAHSIANSAAIITRPDCHRHWVRPGIMLYGANPLGEAAAPTLRPVMTLRSQLLAVRDIDAGDSVGYNHTWTAPAATRIGTVAIGYGDGYPRHAGNGTPVLVNGKRASLVGRVSMDTITVDLGAQTDARAGDEVILWGEGLPVNDVAVHAGTIAYELLTRISGRVRYIYRRFADEDCTAK
jgi:alanine racemase